MKRQPPKPKRPRGRPTVFSPDEWTKISRLPAPLIRRLATALEDSIAAEHRRLTTAVRLDSFHMLTGVWQDGEFGSAVWAQLQKQIDNGGDLNDSERAVLSELLSRMRARPAARKALGIRARSRTADRNDEIAYCYMQLRVQGKSATAATSAVREQFPNIGARTIRAVLESRKLLGYARARVLASHRAKSTPTK